MRHVFEVDLRALAALRVALGLLLIADALIRAPDLALFLTDGGFVPRDAVSAHYGTPRPSLHALGGGLAWQWLLTCATLLFAVMLALGWRTRLATLASVLLLASLPNRNPLLLRASCASNHPPGVCGQKPHPVGIPQAG